VAVQPNQVLVGLLTENTPRMLAQAERLLRSIRWFGGTMADARIVVCSVNDLASDARTTFESLGAETRIVRRFHPQNPTANRHSLIGSLLDEPEDFLFLLDCDTIVVQDPLPHLGVQAFHAKIAPINSVTDEVFDRLYAHFGLRKPALTQVNPFSRTASIPYFNAGVFAIPTELARVLAPSWSAFNRKLADDPTLAAPCQRHIHQASLSLALSETGIPVAAMPDAMNYQLNNTQFEPPPGYMETDPVIIHYHHLVSDDGRLMPTVYRGAQPGIERFNQRMQELLPAAPRARTAETSTPILVLGMHRSGTSLVTEVIAMLGSHAGDSSDLLHADMFNPTGYWEHLEVLKLDIEILNALSSRGVRSPIKAAVDTLPPEQRADFVRRARVIADSFRDHDSFVLKDPRMSVLLPIWREAVPDAIAVIVWRDPLAVARSMSKRDRRPLLRSLALWEHHNRVLLRESEGMPRILVSYDQLVAEPERVLAALHDSLNAMGAKGLRFPTSERLRQSVHPEFNRNATQSNEDLELLTGQQRAMLDSFQRGSILDEPIAPTSEHVVTFLSETGTLESTVQELEDILQAVFTSRSWQVGSGASALLRILRRERSVSAKDRWNESRRRRHLDPR
jgi:hypothetical protein